MFASSACTGRSSVFVLIQISYLNVALSLSIFNQFDPNDAVFDILVDYDELIGTSTREDTIKENFSLPVVMSFIHIVFGYIIP